MQKKGLATVQTAQLLVEQQGELGANALVPIRILDFRTKESSLTGTDMEKAN